MHEMNVPIQKLDAEAIIPRYAYEGDAGLDMRSNADMVIHPFERAQVPTGLAIAVPDGYAALLLPRSGMAFKQGLTLINTPSLIDSRYRGEIKIAVINLDPREDVVIGRGDRIAQLMVIEVPRVGFQECERLDATERAAGGFGSSGVR